MSSGSATEKEAAPAAGGDGAGTACADEEKFVRLFMTLTGCAASDARNAYMYFEVERDRHGH